MFKKVAADVLGLSDIGKIIDPKDYDKVASDDYILHEEGEQIFFLIKSQSDEYCFTNYGLIHLDGSSATSKKRLLKRFTYKNNRLSEVKLETAGTIDLDIEIKFIMGDISYSIDVNKQDLDRLKDLYKVLISISSIQKDNALELEFAHQSLDIATNCLKSYNSNTIEENFKAVNLYSFQWLKKTHKEFTIKDFGHIFEKFINQ